MGILFRQEQSVLLKQKVVTTNRKAYHNYTIVETYEAGLMLAGYEVKSLRAGDANLTDGFVSFRGDEAFIENIHIPPYAQQSTHIQDYDTRRRRKLLLNKREIVALSAKVREKGLTVVALELYFNERGIAKLEIGLGKGKRTVDKRETLKRRDIDRETQRELHS